MLKLNNKIITRISICELAAVLLGFFCVCLYDRHFGDATFLAYISPLLFLFGVNTLIMLYSIVLFVKYLFTESE